MSFVYLGGFIIGLLLIVLCKVINILLIHKGIDSRKQFYFVKKIIIRKYLLSDRQELAMYSSYLIMFSLMVALVLVKDGTAFAYIWSILVNLRVLYYLFALFALRSKDAKYAYPIFKSNLGSELEVTLIVYLFMIFLGSALIVFTRGIDSGIIMLGCSLIVYLEIAIAILLASGGLSRLIKKNIK